MVDATPKRMSPLDRLSDLPESIISDILSVLPTKDAVATSILSRSWRSRWTRISSFNFRRPENKHCVEDAAPTSDFSDFVNMVLLNHCGESINKFVLRWESPHFRPAQLNTWFNVAINRNVRVLDLNTNPRWTARGPGEFLLPFSLYTSGTLEVLKLRGPFRIKPPNMVRLPKLSEIKLSLVMYESDESLPGLISGCPLLESLTIEREVQSDNMVVCSISSPALKRVSIFFYGLRLDDVDSNEMELRIDAPKLEYLNLFDHLSKDISIQPRLSSVNNLSFEVLTHHNKVVEWLQDYGNVKFLSIGENLTSASYGDILYVSTVGFAQYSYAQLLPWSSMMDVIDSCVKLEELEIWCFVSNTHNDLVGRGPRSSLSSLRCLTLRNFNGYKKEMEMLKFFLDHGVVMETVTLSSCKPRVSAKKAERKRILDKVNKFSRASPTCKISWHEFPGLKSCFEYLGE